MAVAPQPVLPPPIPIIRRRRRRLLPRLVGGAVAIAVLAGAGWGGLRAYQSMTATSGPNIPTARVHQGDVSFDIHAQGSLKGGGSEMLTAPAVTGTLNIKSMMDAGDTVKPGDVVFQLDTSTQEYNLTQAKEALEQAQQQVIQAQATADAQTVDDAYQLDKARFDVQRAALQVQKNPISAAVDARKNDLALQTAKDHVAALEKDIAGRKASNEASVATQKAALAKAQADAATAQQSIDSMTVKAKHAGYVSLEQNSNQNIIFFGMQLPPFQVGDMVRPGMAVAEIPDTSSWEVNLTVSELDAGHLVAGEPARIEFAALPGQTFSGKLKSVGAVQGPAWNRQVRCVVGLDDPSPSLRPGFSGAVVIEAETLKNVLWAPSQAVFDAGGGQSYVYRKTGAQFARQPVNVVRRSESQVVLSGLGAGDVIALSNPEQAAAAKAKSAASASPLGGAGK